MGGKGPICVPPPSISWKNRPKVSSFEKGCGFLGLAMVMLQIIIAIYIISGANGEYNPQAAMERNCPGGRVSVGDVFCVDQGLSDEYIEMTASGTCGNGGHSVRHLETNDDAFLHTRHLTTHALLRRLGAEEDTMWDRFAQNAEVPLVLIPLVFIVGMLWIALLQKFAKACIYGALLVAVVFFIFLSIFPTLLTFAFCNDNGNKWITSNDQIGQDRCARDGGEFYTRSGEFVWVFLIPAVAIAGLTICFKKKINVAAMCLSKCCLCLQQRPDIIVSALGVFASFIFYLGMWVGFALNFFSHYEISCSDWSTEPEIRVKENGTIMKIMGILVVPTYIYFEMMILVVVAAGVGGWYFQDGEDTPAVPSRVGLRWAYGSSSGAVFLATLITWPIIEVRNYIHSVWGKFAILPCLPCSWVYYIFYIMWCCFMRSYLAFTRFMLIAHTFHGGDIFATARNSWTVLKKHLGGAVVTDTIAAYILNLGVWVISISFGFIAWIWMEQAMERGFLEDMFTATNDGQTVLLTVLGMIAVISWLCKHSLFTIILCAFAGEYLKGGVLADVHPFLCGVFTGAICNIIFSFIAKIVQAAMDTIFYCFALEAERATTQSREGFADITNMIKENVVKPMPKYMESADNIEVNRLDGL